MNDYKRAEDPDSIKKQMLIYSFFGDMYNKINNNSTEKRKIESLRNYYIQKSDVAHYEVIGANTTLTIDEEDYAIDKEKVNEYAVSSEITDIFRLCSTKLKLKKRGISIIRDDRLSYLDSGASFREKRENYIKQGVSYHVSDDGSLHIFSVEQSKKYIDLFKDYVTTKEIWRRRYNKDGEEIKNGGTVTCMFESSPEFADSTYEYTTYRVDDYIIREVWTIHNEVENNTVIKNEPQFAIGLVHKIQEGEKIEALDKVEFEKQLDEKTIYDYILGLTLGEKMYERATPVLEKKTIENELIKYKKHGSAIMR